MKADIPLAERQHRELEDQRDIRAALVRRHVQVLAEDAAIQAVLMARNIERGPAFAAVLAPNARG